MEPPFLIEADRNSVFLGWKPVEGALQYELQMISTPRIKSDTNQDSNSDESAEVESVDWVTLTDSLKCTSVVKKNIDEAYEYRFRLRAKFDSGWDIFSKASTNMFSISKENYLMDPPTVLRSDSTSITLTWKHVDEADGYRLRYRLDSDLVWEEAQTVIQGNTVKKKHLSPNQGYYFAIKPVVEGQNWEYSRSSKICFASGVRTRYPSKCGYATVQGRIDWLEANGIKDSELIASISQSLEADKDPTAPLYYWQLYSLLGPDKIHALVSRFYKRVFDDYEAPWFRTAFARISDMEHHVATQTQFWVDVMGGGKCYHGGDYRLNFHHTHNASTVMNAEGAKRWMHHMRLAILDNEKDPNTCYSSVDERIIPCLKDFLKTKMMKYASEHNWKFDDSDFDDFPS